MNNPKHKSMNKFYYKKIPQAYSFKKIKKKKNKFGLAKLNFLGAN